jgi:integrase
MACIRKRRGKWVADWCDGGGVRHWTTFDTKREAEECLDRERQQSRQRTGCVAPASITVEAYSKRWLSLIQSVVKAGTYRRYEQLLKHHINSSIGGISVRHLHKGMIKDFLTRKLTETVKHENPHVPLERRKEVHLARNTVRNIHATLRAMLRSAVDDGVILGNPAEKIGRQLRLVTPKATRQEAIKAMTREQRQTFLSTACEHDRRCYELFFTLAGTGMRLGEALALQWTDLDLVGRKIRVERAFSDGVVNTPKSGHGRTVDLSKPLADTLKRLESDRKAESLKKGWREVPGWVFVSEVGTPLDGSNVRKAMIRILKNAKLPLHFTPHCLRHTYASLMLQQGKPVAYVQRQLGHASIQLTVDTYGKWLPMESKSAVDRLDSPITQSGSKMVANQSDESRKLWSWREESNLQPAVYK